MAKPITFNPAPTGLVSVICGGGVGLGGSSLLHDAQANTAPKNGRRISLRDQREETSDDNEVPEFE